jgi:hypothetical protein
VTELDGRIVEGLLDGIATIRFANQSSLLASFQNGVLSGLSRVFRCKFEECDFEDILSWNDPTWLAEVSSEFSS